MILDHSPSSRLRRRGALYISSNLLSVGGALRELVKRQYLGWRRSLDACSALPHRTDRIGTEVRYVALNNTAGSTPRHSCQKSTQEGLVRAGTRSHGSAM